ncbi:hypothetical protein FSARC_2437 [Fusarium sarcochroum]|uniref:Uncharacterized protein n=1 Tax=Fusarium sarcochroum TaxID=1208366 RepID=A0A8H4U6M0_9HYPO|nr:hypothetical protein FSARC_2437 [Fusarium sarcochroum]
MEELIRDAIFSHLLRLMTGGRVFKYPEEEDPSQWKKYVHVEKSAKMARHGQPQPPEDHSEQQSSEPKNPVVFIFVYCRGFSAHRSCYGLGPMVCSLLSEILQIGRNPVDITTFTLLVVFQVLTTLATNFGMLLVFRFITGSIGSPSLATDRASIGDMYKPSKRTYSLAI